MEDTLRHRYPRGQFPEQGRIIAELDSSDDDIDTPSSHSQARQDDNDGDDNEISSRWISILDIFRVLFLFFLASSALSYYVTNNSILWGYRPWFTKWPMVKMFIHGPILLTPDQLSLYNGTSETLPIYIAVNSTIFDVSASRHTYGPGGSYSFFAGRDATRAFVSGCFRDDLTPDIRGLEQMHIPVEDNDEDPEERDMSETEKMVRGEEELREANEKVKKQVDHWEGFFRNHDRYFEVGRLVGSPGVEGKGVEMRKLCASAEKARPKRRKLKERREREEKKKREKEMKKQKKQG
ncbi:hypothetical protein AJ80_01787 [Polytolypa hystricis UAMH7299]|uniref:Cytochrome b5 heme-binding domain-containing protein n=1 Tax=Polytolypa hystricis (strain UAMH7299) TaxID=1447883 RepID=A0A2B7YR34_POLH7|nr:hypothetical protein AJ80_01787 [Polytolypa hystricis UAMH7299]